MYRFSINKELFENILLKKTLILEKENTNSFLIEGYDSDSFMLELNTKLELEQPEILEKPFSYLHSIFFLRIYFGYKVAYCKYYYEYKENTWNAKPYCSS